MQQKVLCIKSDLLFQKGKWNGLLQSDLDYYYDLLRQQSEFRVRAELEDDPSFKQIIVQVILKYNGKYFLHKQVHANEKRLNSLSIIPLGGHIEQFDALEGQDIIQVALEREMAEEAEIATQILNKKFLGLIYLEDGNPVNYMHVGLLYLFDLESDAVKMHEDGLETIGWVDAEYLRANTTQISYWSKVFVEAILTQP